MKKAVKIFQFFLNKAKILKKVKILFKVLF